MYQPGHLHLEHLPVQRKDVAYSLHIRYEVQHSEHGRAVHFSVLGDIAGKPVDEHFELPRELAFNFASHVDHVARQNGLPPTQVVPLSLHKQYDEMFEDIRRQLEIKPGEGLSAERLDKL
ncbi:DUF5064 family protein [Pseudomonas typographi]|uniref:DUF5064 family protein n=1 Tax=Pseudomonas typographi TaxID=2715964 RepID=A0ABR7YXE2_9PSED|nr:DUF5064 family protein [Pseudomonas typographi]MBD1597872.1 DUF5064 family protein [Pseudomonas typographi]